MLKLFAHYLFSREGLEAFYVLWGISAGNGKGSLLKLLRITCGSYFHDPDFVSLAAGKRNPAGPDPSTMAFRGRRLLFVADTDAGAKLDTYRLKTFSEGDSAIKARNLYKDQVEFPARWGLFIATNRKMQFSGGETADEGVVRRLRVIEFPFKFCARPA